MSQSQLDISRFWFVEPADLETRLSQDYHEATKTSEFLFSFGPEDPKRTPAMMKTINAVAGKSKSYTYAPRFELTPEPWDALKISLGSLIENRRTDRSFSDAPFTLSQLATLLVCGAGITGTINVGENEYRDGRAYPSGGGLYPLEVYPIVFNVDGLENGIYHFDVRHQCLHQLVRDNVREKVKSAFLGDSMFEKAAVSFLVTAVFKRSAFKYGERSYRLVNIEAGHLVHNLLLVGQALGLSVVPVNGYFDRQIEQLINVDGVEESIIYTALGGCPAQ